MDKGDALVFGASPFAFIPGQMIDGCYGEG